MSAYSRYDCFAVLVMSTKCSGHTEYVPSPCPHPRIRPEGAAYAERNRGNMERWFDYSSNVDNYNSPRPGEKLCTDTARQIAKVTFAATMVSDPEE